MTEPDTSNFTGYAEDSCMTGGYACGSCGWWVTRGSYHACYSPTIVCPTFTTIDSVRLAELMEAERKLKEIKQILGEYQRPT